jgi:hypothetical protein
MDNAGNTFLGSARERFGRESGPLRDHDGFSCSSNFLAEHSGVEGPVVGSEHQTLGTGLTVVFFLLEWGSECRDTFVLAASR